MKYKEGYLAVIFLILVFIILGIASYYVTPWCNDYGDVC